MSLCPHSVLLIFFSSCHRPSAELAMRLSYVPFLYEGGHGVEQDYAKVREHFKLAAKQGLIDTREALEALEVLDLLD